MELLEEDCQLELDISIWNLNNKRSEACEQALDQDGNEFGGQSVKTIAKLKNMESEAIGAFRVAGSPFAG